MKIAARFLQLVLRDRWLGLCAGLLLLIVLAALVGPSLTGYGYDRISPQSLQPPSWSHLAGTDVNGRDLLTRTLSGARVSLLVAFFGTMLSLFIGVTYGMVSGYVGGSIDSLMMRVVEILYSLPTLIVVIVLVTSLDDVTARTLTVIGLRAEESRLVLIFLFLGLTQWLSMARIIRGQVLVLKEQAFVQASLALGQSHFGILFRHLLPNLLGLVVVNLTLTIPAVMLDESFMSFLGVGLQEPLASWGTLIAEGAGLINPFRIYWWLLLFPGLMMSATLLALNFLGDGLRDALDPRVKK